MKLLTDGRNRITINLLWVQKVQQSNGIHIKQKAIAVNSRSERVYSTLVIKYCCCLMRANAGQRAERGTEGERERL